MTPNVTSSAAVLSTQESEVAMRAVEVQPKPIVRRVIARTAHVEDADQIAALLSLWAQQGLTIARSADTVRLCIGEFVVAAYEDDDAAILACGALVAHSPEIGEIRSVASAEAAKGTGAGSEVVRFLIEEAESIRMDTLVLLTKVPGFFARFGFHEISPLALPEDFVRDQINARGRTFKDRIVMRLQLAMS
ncbi:MAG: GNAT family N-acetyltransferase [Phycisphaeraceae bacterium]|nr:GNAT family N-acetyltransferase [Phycisphaerales bacterium]MCB9860728.1 GNAT family N-acetyltransferase [Phycisphaeraceae bacterium]